MNRILMLLLITAACPLGLFAEERKESAATPPEPSRTMSERLRLELDLAEARLDALVAGYDALLAYCDKPSDDMLQRAIETDSDYLNLLSKRSETESVRQRNQDTFKPDSPIHKRYDDEIASLDKQVEEHLERLAQTAPEELKKANRRNFAPRILEAEIALASQRALIASLRKKYDAMIKDERKKSDSSPSQSSESVGSPAIDPDWVVVLEKRVEVARKNFESIDQAYKIGHPTGTAIAQAGARVDLADAEIALYRYTGDAAKHLEACERKAEYAKYKHNAVDAAYKTASKSISFRDLLDAELGVVEAEYELKEAKPEE